MKVQIELQNKTSFIVDLPITMKLCEFFTLEELANNKGNPALPQFIINREVDIYLAMLSEFRRWFAKPMKITSCYRQPAYNDSLPNADKRSAHKHACAGDWWIQGHTETQRRNVKNKWESLCNKYGVIGAVNFYTDGYHLEIFTDKWYGKKTFQVRDYRGKKGDW